MDDGRIGHGPETTPPVVANHGGGDIDNPDAMSGIAYGRINWKGSGGDSLETNCRLCYNKY